MSDTVIAEIEPEEEDEDGYGYGDGGTYVDLGGQPLPVMPEMCGSCMFREDEGAIELRPGRLEEIKRQSLEFIPQVCHWHHLHGDTATIKACRGARDFLLTMLYRMGRIEEPTDEALATVMEAAGVPAPEAPVPGRKSRVS